MYRDANLLPTRVKKRRRINSYTSKKGIQKPLKKTQGNAFSASLCGGKSIYHAGHKGAPG